MKHRVAGRKLGRTSSHRLALLRNLSRGAVRERADHHDPQQGQGAAAVRRETRDALQARDAARPAPGAPPHSGPGGRREDVRHDLGPVRPAARGLHAHRQARPAPGRQRRDGVDRAGGRRGQGRRSKAKAGIGRSRRADAKKAKGAKPAAEQEVPRQEGRRRRRRRTSAGEEGEGAQGARRRRRPRRSPRPRPRPRGRRRRPRPGSPEAPETMGPSGRAAKSQEEGALGSLFF